MLRMRSDDALRVGQIEGNDTASFAAGKVPDGGLEGAFGANVGESGGERKPQGEAASFAEGATGEKKIGVETIFGIRNFMGLGKTETGYCTQSSPLGCFGNTAESQICEDDGSLPESATGDSPETKGLQKFATGTVRREISPMQTYSGTRLDRVQGAGMFVPVAWKTSESFSFRSKYYSSLGIGLKTIIYFTTDSTVISAIGFFGFESSFVRNASQSKSASKILEND
ncbi:hypothetical protein B0H16DRAFT_1467671 [Mycena metata]|uniref:Uncharacterized protein n=1 Tax=Mycena metata TaxID=1033252 RepID=A0AAD7I3P6_9AGAR|nr:hypothetical protein B0H16DRAFT_1467671 [Mycena metata]